MKAQISLGSASSLSAWRIYVLGYEKMRPAKTQADLSHRWVHIFEGKYFDFAPHMYSQNIVTCI